MISAYRATALVAATPCVPVQYQEVHVVGARVATVTRGNTFCRLEQPWRQSPGVRLERTVITRTFERTRTQGSNASGQWGCNIVARHYVMATALCNIPLPELAPVKICNRDKRSPRAGCSAVPWAYIT